MGAETAPFASKAGTYDVLLFGETEIEAEVYIISDTPTEMVVRLVDNGELYTLAKAVQ